MTRGEGFLGKGKCNKIYCSAMSNIAWCDLNFNNNILRVHDYCQNPKCKYIKNKLISHQKNFNLKVLDLKIL